MAKELYFDDEARSKLVRGITKMAGAVKSTLGPRGNTVLIESSSHVGAYTVTKDGVTVARSISLADPVEDMAVRLMRESADKTASLAGDGTTTAVVLAEALVESGTRALTESVNKTRVLRRIQDIMATIDEELLASGIPVTDELLVNVATISANNDRRIGELIAGVYGGIGKDGIVTVEKSKTSETHTDVTHGFSIDRGWYSRYFVNDQRRDECVYEDVMVLVTDAEIHNLLQIENVLRPVIEENKRLLIIAPCSKQVINTLAANVLKNGLKLVAIEPPSFGYKRNELMEDISVALGAKYFSENTGDNLELMTYADLGHASKVIVGPDKTIIVNSEHRTSQEKVSSRIEQLRASHDDAKQKHEKDFIMQRIAALTGGVGVIYVGGDTDIEQKELYDRVDDAVCAVRSALEEGVLPGGGVALRDISKRFFDDDSLEMEERIAMGIVYDALIAPMYQILKNAGYSGELLVASINKVKQMGKGCGINVVDGRIGDMVEMGIVDPVKVTRTALRHAVSVATTILSTNAVISEKR